MCEIVVLQSFLEPVREAVRSTADHYRCVERSTTPGGRGASLTFSALLHFYFFAISPYLRESRSLRMALTSSIIPTLALHSSIIHHFGPKFFSILPLWPSNSSLWRYSPPLWPYHQ